MFKIHNFKCIFLYVYLCKEVLYNLNVIIYLDLISAKVIVFSQTINGSLLIQYRYSHFQLSSSAAVQVVLKDKSK